MIPKNEYAGTFLWTEARERVPNDYKTLDFVPTKNDGFRNETEEADYWDKLSEMENDLINY